MYYIIYRKCLNSNAVFLKNLFLLDSPNKHFICKFSAYNYLHINMHYIFQYIWKNQKIWTKVGSIDKKLDLAVYYVHNCSLRYVIKFFGQQISVTLKCIKYICSVRSIVIVSIFLVHVKLEKKENPSPTGHK